MAPVYSRRKKRGGKGARNRRKARRANRQVMTNRMPRMSKSVVAAKYFTTMEIGFQGLLSVAATQSQSFRVSSAILNKPLATNQSFTGAVTGASLVGPGTQNINNMYPLGWSQLTQLYGAYRVHATKLNATFTPTASADALEFAVLPVQWDGSVMEVPNDYPSAKLQPYSKFRQCTGNNNIRQNTIVSKLKNRTIYGLSKEQMRTGDTSFVIDNDVATGPELNQYYSEWLIYYQKYNAGVFTSPCNISLTVTYFVEWMQPRQDYSVEV